MGFSVSTGNLSATVPEGGAPAFDSGATREVRDRAFQPQLRVAQTVNLLPGSGFSARTAKVQLW
jgi:hypothetical protein